MNFIKRSKDLIKYANEFICDLYLDIIKMIDTNQLDEIPEISGKISEISTDFDKLFSNENRRKKSKENQLKNGVPANILQTLTTLDDENFVAQKSINTQLLKINKILNKYKDQLKDRNVQFTEQMADLEGSGDKNQMEIAKWRYLLAEKRLLLEFKNQVEIKTQTSLQKIIHLSLQLSEDRQGSAK
jgi:hypothetical protein